MLLQFTVSNFRAFRERQTLNLAASNYDKTLPANCISCGLPGLKGQRWLKGGALYGPNAGGKTTLLRALEALAVLVRESASTTDPRDPISQVEPFGLAPGEPVEPTAFGVTFVSDGIRYEYRVAATTRQVLHESVRAFPNGKEQLWFSRDWLSAQESYSWSPERTPHYRRDSKKEEYTLPNVLFLSKAISLGDTALEPLFRWFKDQLHFFDLSAGGRTLGKSFSAQQFVDKTPLSPRILDLLQHADLGVETASVELTDASSKKDEALLDFFGQQLARMRREIQEMKITQQGLNYGLVPEVTLSHRSRAHGPVALPWDSESAGTQRLFALAGRWLDILDRGYTVCMDELETSMHPVLVMALLRLLFSEDTNPTGAQIIFTTHNPLLLDPTLLRRDQVWFADKDDHGEAHLYPLTDYAPRKGESLGRGYLSGRYGAVPFIPEGLLGTGYKSAPELP
ncbi:MAG: ATP-binding protein [Verrucomicrobiota bacterium]